MKKIHSDIVSLHDYRVARFHSEAYCCRPAHPHENGEWTAVEALHGRVSTLTIPDYPADVSDGYTAYILHIAYQTLNRLPTATEFEQWHDAPDNLEKRQ